MRLRAIKYLILYTSGRPILISAYGITEVF